MKGNVLQQKCPGQPHAEAVGSTNVLLMAPEALVLQIEARAYSSITWLYNDSVMHDFLRLRLEDFSKRLVLVNTTVTDAGLYEADVHTIANESVIHVLFNVSVQPTSELLPKSATFIFFGS